MIKTRFGETLPQAPNILHVTPFETTQRHLRNVSDHATYKKLYSSLSAVLMTALKARVKSGEPKAIKEVWEQRDKTFLALDFEWSERNEKSALEWGYAAVRCGHLDAQGHWPPIPDSNYRKGHYIVGEYVDKVVNKHFITHPWMYAFGDSQVITKAKLPRIIQATIDSLASPDSETIPNKLVLVGHGISGDLQRLSELKIKLPNNMLVIDTALFERMLFTSGERPTMMDPKTGKLRQPNVMFSLENVLRTFTTADSDGRTVPVTLPNVMMHNSGNDAFLCLWAFQKLLDPEGTKVPSIKKGWIGKPGTGPLGQAGMNAMNGMVNGDGMGVMTIPTMTMHPMPMAVPTPMAFSGFATVGPGAGYDLASEMSKIQLESRRHSRSPGARDSFMTSPPNPRRRSSGPTTGMGLNGK